ncbi:hypothetical protein EJB05_00271, partial [Eragrostis curvula]
MSKDVVLIAASVAALLLISATTFFCSRRRQSPSQRSVDALGHDVELGRGVAGLDEAVLAAYPTLVFSPPPRGEEKQEEKEGREDEEEGEKEKKKAAGTAAAASPAGDTARCAVCQADYADGDELRMLPDCQHAFHRGCVDQWLRRRPTCPVCRASPSPARSSEERGR